MNYLEYSNQGPEIAIYTIFGLSALLIRSIWSQVETGSIFLNNKNSMSSKTLVSFIFDNNDGGVVLSTDSVMVCDTLLSVAALFSTLVTPNLDGLLLFGGSCSSCNLFFSYKNRENTVK